ncbi:hypothetical protein S7711_07261 [Stachybotrys chartarum IBT 7711]|uniref:Uncharacterized protein n=1 Tax=Stachybotrys chartarum (strain CBS 109288 / IBT 7711) TaxID=1280523 RepID=A0A084AS93_STACB|nr:hypothetical protein S7711_07261 [Stachybotrys chartarum IBT 7711]
MSEAIDIPAQPSRHSRAVAEHEEFPLEDGPYFGFIEVFPSGDVSWSLSAGSGKYVEVSPRRRLPPLAFIVEKDQISKKITVEVISLSLKQAVYRAILNQDPSLKSVHIDFEALLQYYEALKSHCNRLESHRPHSSATAELKLLVDDLLPEKALFDGIGMEAFRQRGVLSLLHLQDIHQRNLHMGLDEIENCFFLGLIPDEINDEYMQALNTRYAEFARSGDLTGLQDLCEPIVRSGEIELQYNPSLLLEVIENGCVELYQYMLELVDRTRDNTVQLSDCQRSLADITFDPFHVAIRLGQVELVRSFVNNAAIFEGRIHDSATPSNNHIFTPLSSAVFWRQPQIVQLLLHSGPTYSSGYLQAVSLALSGNFVEILDILSHYEQHAAPNAASPMSSQSSLAYEPSDSYLCPNPVGSMGWMSLSHQVNAVDINNCVAGMISNPIAESIHQVVDPRALHCPSVQQNFDFRTAGLDAGSPFTRDVLPSTDIMRGPEPAHRLSQEHLPFMRQSVAHQTARLLGQDFVQRLDLLRNKILELHSQSTAAVSYSRLLQNFNSVENIWEGGIEVFRRITRNEAPAGLVGVLQCLLIADALAFRASSSHEDVYKQFTDDLGRWRTVLTNFDEQRIFDTVVGHVWEVDSAYNLGTPQSGADQIYRCQEFIQNLVSVDQLDPRLQRKVRSLGTHLRTIQQRIGQRALANDSIRHTTRSRRRDSGVHRPIQHVLGRLTRDTDSGDEGDIDLNEFLYLEAIQEEDSARDRKRAHVPISNNTWKDISPMVVLLLASVAFSIVLAMIPASEAVQSKSQSQVDPHMSPGGSSSIFSTDLSSTDTAPSSDRFRCLSHKCPKTFSSVSNRNKHMREGCAFRSKKGYPCRNENCSKILTTKWYRSTQYVPPLPDAGPKVLLSRPVVDSVDGEGRLVFKLQGFRRRLEIGNMESL